MLAQGRALDKVAAEPGGAGNGDVYILNETHATHANQIAIRDDGAWVYVTPLSGWLIYNVAAGYYEKFSGASWNELVTGGGGGDTHYRVGFFFIDTPAANEPLLRHVFTDAVTFTDDFGGAVASVGVNATATYVLDVKKGGASVGTISISNTGVATFATTAGSLSFAAGEVLGIYGAAVPDATLAQVAVTLKGTI